MVHEAPAVVERCRYNYWSVVLPCGETCVQILKWIIPNITQRARACICAECDEAAGSRALEGRPGELLSGGGCCLFAESYDLDLGGGHLGGIRRLMID
jgi:hypothetical protein